MTDDDGRVVGTLAMVTDITERKEAEARIQRIARLYAVSSSVNEAIVRVRDTQELYDRACRIAVEQGLLRLAWVGLYDEPRRMLQPVARFGTGADYGDHVMLRMDEAAMNSGPAGRALSTGSCVVENDVASASGFFRRDEALARGLRSCAAFPLTIKERRVGVLLLYADRPGYFQDEEVRVLGALADDIAFAVASAENEAERRRLLHDLGERVKELTLLHRMASLTDLSMPGLTGTELARRVRELRPGLPIVLTSGYLRPEDAEAVRRVADVEVIPKPNLVADLGPTLHRLLVRQRSSP